MEGSIVYTTGAWYYRVASAVRRGSGNGALSSRLASLSGPQQAVVIGNLGLLPSRVGLIGPRVLVPVMAALETRRRPNLLTAEALAVALVADAEITVTTESLLLRDCAADLGIACRSIE